MLKMFVELVFKLSTYIYNIKFRSAPKVSIADKDNILRSNHTHTLTEQHFDSHAEGKNWGSDWFASSDEHIYWHNIYNLPKRW